jgi:small-conductance mechanosensitive channel
MDSTHTADSVRRVTLLRQIEELKDSEKSQARMALLAKLKEQQYQDSIRKAGQILQLNLLKANAVGYAVSPFIDTLFFVHTRVGSFSPADRARSISERIEQLYDDYEFKPDSLKISIGEASTEIVYKDQVIMSLNELEALWFDKKPKELAMAYQEKIKGAIVQEREENSITNIFFRVGAVLMIIVGSYLVILLINFFFKRLRVKISTLKNKYLRGIKIKNYQLLDSDRELEVVLFITNILRLLVIVIALYVALPLMFSVFPWTRGIADTLIGWILLPLKNVVWGFIKYLPNIFAIIVIAVVTRYVIKFLQFIAGEIETGALTIQGFYPDWAKPTMNIVKFLLYAFSFIIIFPYLPGSDSPIFQGVSVFVGILFSLGSSSAISNAVAGLVITYMRPFKVGDRIKIGDICGDVVEKSLLVTRIRTIKNEDITVPNASILSGHTINYSTSAKELGLILHTTVTIGYDVPWKQVHQLLIQAALDTDGISRKENHRPFILQTSLDDFYVSYQLNVYTDQSNRMATLYSELHQHIQDRFNEAGVEIMSPHYRAARDGNMTTIPTSYLDKSYRPGAFRVHVEERKRDEDNA